MTVLVIVGVEGVGAVGTEIVSVSEKTSETLVGATAVITVVKPFRRSSPWNGGLVDCGGPPGSLVAWVDSVIVLITYDTTSGCFSISNSFAVPIGAVTSVPASPCLVDSPSNVTNAFSAGQLRFPALSLADMMVGERGIEKLAWACWMSRGIASPRVTLLVFVSPATPVVVHPSAPAIEQSVPIKALVQMQEQTPLFTTFVPPLRHVS